MNIFCVALTFVLTMSCIILDSKDVLNAANKRNTAAEEATLTSTKSETGPDGSKVTTHISTTTNKTKGNINRCRILNVKIICIY